MPRRVRPRLLCPSLQLSEGTDVAMEEIQIPKLVALRLLCCSAGEQEREMWLRTLI